ncbi:transporter [Leptospira semungkisensis]|uniref:Transporter n=1 Tax=Leptospira semungkisensis TaxID=2484985 RepID=A0A4R9G151_9LEPT|nr:sodium/solute symporter [Leptospira semungkisensis]TGK04923.1 transporter [Leptospira semungkisensis]
MVVLGILTVFNLIDAVFFLSTLAIVLGVGFYAGRKEESGEDYFLGGRSLPWWGVAGSLFGTNVSANHLVGMLGIGFSVGFAQSHYMWGAIPALLLLSYVFLPLYRRRKIFTLSQFLGDRYGEKSKLLYSGIVLVLISIQLAAGLYIGSRSLLPFWKDLGWNGIGYVEGVLLLGFLSTVYTWFGGLKAVVYTDVIQSVLILFAGLLLAYLTIHHPAVGGWEGLWLKESLVQASDRRMDLFLSSDHSSLPWTGALTGLFFLHIFYWGTNQYVVQRTLGASSLREARAGILGDGFLTLIIPFFTVLTGVAAYHLWNSIEGVEGIDPDEAFSKLVSIVIPGGYGFGGVILAGLLGAIFSSVDSLLNSGSTLFTLDFYPKFRKTPFARRHLGEEITDKETVQVGRWFLLFFSGITILLALLIYTPNSKGNFFLEISGQSAHFTLGLLSVFLVGAFWKKSNGTAAWITILLCPILSILLPKIYSIFIIYFPALEISFGKNLNFLHRVFVVSLFGISIQILLSLFFPQEKRSGERGLRVSFSKKTVWLGIFFLFGIVGIISLRATELLGPSGSAWTSAIFSFFFFLGISIAKAKKFPPAFRTRAFFRNDIWIAGLLISATLWLYFIFS